MLTWHSSNGDDVSFANGTTSLDDVIDALGTESIEALFPGDVLVEPDEIARAMTSGNPDEYIKSQVRARKVNNDFARVKINIVKCTLMFPSAL